MRPSDFRSAEPAGLRFHGAPLRGEGLHLCREEMYHEPTQEDGCQLRGKPRHRAAVRTTARQQLGVDRRRHDRGTTLRERYPRPGSATDHQIQRLSIHGNRAPPLPSERKRHQGSEHACQERRILGESPPSTPHQEREHDGRIHEPHRADSRLQVRYLRGESLD